MRSKGGGGGRGVSGKDSRGSLFLLAFNAGGEAQKRGLAIGACPYLRGSAKAADDTSVMSIDHPEAAGWIAGWRSMREAALMYSVWPQLIGASFRGGWFAAWDLWAKERGIRWPKDTPADQPGRPELTLTDDPECPKGPPKLKVIPGRKDLETGT